MFCGRPAPREGDSERVVFRDVDATIRTGEIVVLVGRSGSGKSTLLNLIPLLTVGEHLLLPLEVPGQADAAGRARARKLLERVGLRETVPITGGDCA